VKAVVRDLSECSASCSSASAAAPAGPRVEEGFADEAEDEIDRLFGDL
jgi:hypothetical protein